MPKLSESKRSGEIILPISGQRSAQLQQKEPQRASYGVWVKAGIVFAATTGAFVLTKTTGALSWASSWFGGDSQEDLHGIKTSISGKKIILSSGTVSEMTNNFDNVGLTESFDFSDKDASSEIEKFEEVELLDQEENFIR